MADNDETTTHSYPSSKRRPKKDHSVIRAIRAENKALKHALLKRTRELALFIEVGRALTSTLEFKKVLRVILSTARRLVRCEDWSLLLCDDLQEELYYALFKKTSEKTVKSIRYKIGQGPAGRAAEKGLPILIADKEGKRAELKELYPQCAIRSLLCLPIICKNRVIGVIQLLNRIEADAFDDIDLALLSKLVDQASLAIERSDLYQTMSDLASTDDLTKLYNLRYFGRALDVEIKRSKRYNLSLSLIFIDIDYFKRVNDQHGHLAGSKVLVEMAGIIRESFRVVDVVARYGGDEFVVILPETDMKKAYQVAERVRLAVLKYEFLRKKGLSLKITASLGVAGFPEHTDNQTDLIHLADQAMYQAKILGRNRTFLA
ncbi:MAG: diguanylate cyclase [Nitrospiria bacterium]